ncbi:MAG: bifunctional diaminohydroxyphosphoribosylaminopyrimidine deaminase/5-amino-6-(5-phosphoribosylamino)uracil reductase RibD [Planctomycetes bacterium]|nr:bifunctional diaminohydroxyphosphoribosylaminopyrimidine deaminase/5-amino-6-(5-phosphoribosylamino)uracil reductase RibD [Planctomycetota bacterium]
MSDDRRFMWHALELAKRGRPYVAPNPMCGALIVKDGRIVGEGYHTAFGEPHAEVMALKQAGPNARGSTMYVTLEPCFEHYEGKKTPPCVPRLIDAGISRVFIAVPDPHKHVAGKGAKALMNAGVKVIFGLCEEEARELNAAYFSLVERKRPLVTAKWAMTLDGKIATRTGDAKWISSEQSRAEVHANRACTGAVIVGIGTLLADDPELTIHAADGRQPVRVVVDTDLAIPMTSKLVETANDSPVFIYAAEDTDTGKQAQLEEAGAYVILLKRQSKTHLNWVEVCADLGERDVSSVTIEGGGKLIASAFQARVIDRVCIYIAPKVFGGENARSPVEGPGIPEVGRAVTFNKMHTRNVGCDLVVEASVVYPQQDGPSPSGFWGGYEKEAVK